MGNAFKSGYIAILLLATGSAYGRDIVVSVIDSGIDPNDSRVSSYICKNGLVNLTEIPMEKNAQHGMHVAGIIINNSPKSGYCLRIIKFFDPDATPEVSALRMRQAMAMVDGSRLTNISAGGPSFSEKEYNILLKANTFFVLAAGNNGSDLLKNPYFPAAYRLKNSIVVGSLKRDGKKKAASSNYGILVNAWEIGEGVKSFGLKGTTAYMSGTSMATARHTARLLSSIINDDAR